MLYEVITPLGRETGEVVALEAGLRRRGRARPGEKERPRKDEERECAPTPSL